MAANYLGEIGKGFVSGSSVDVTVARAPAADSLIVARVGFRASGSVSLTGGTDNKGNTWTVDGFVNSSSGHVAVLSCPQDVAQLAVGDVVTVTLSGSAGNGLAVVLDELQADTSASRVVTSGTGSATGTSRDSGVTAAAASSGDIAVAAFAGNGAETAFNPDWSGAFDTPYYVAAVGTNAYVEGEWEIVPTDGTVEATPTGGLSATSEGVVVVYKAPAAPAGPQTYYVSKEAGASDSNDGLSTATPFLTLSHALSQIVAGVGTTILLRAGDTWSETFGFSTERSGVQGAPTVLGAYNTNLGNGKAKIVNPNGAGSALISLYPGPTSWVEFRDIDLSQNDFLDADNSAQALSGEHLLEIGAAATNISFYRCYLHHSANTLINSGNGPTPRSTAGNGTGSGDDADWYFEDCEFYAAGNSLIITHGSNWNFVRCHFHRWGESTYASGKHAVYSHSVAAIFDSCIFHNDDCKPGAQCGPNYGSPISQRVTGATIKDCLIHDTNGFSFFWYDDVYGTTTIIRNRCFNMYDAAFYFTAGNDTAPAYTWVAGSTPVDRFVFVKNTMHFQASGGDAIDLSDPAAQYIGGLLFADNVIVGPFTRAISAQTMLANAGVTGDLLERNNVFIATATGDAGTFTFDGTDYTLDGWKALTVDGHSQGTGTFYTADPTLGAAPAGDSRRAPTPYQTLGVIQTPGDNAQVAGTYGAPDFFPQSGSPVIDAGSPVSDNQLTWTAT